ncbi:MAG: rhomboid family intramembrane serine protease [Acidobacteria bacterium]|nr:rhomboid family intramembrane serine protease [Acidobacteriota bacterium]
MLPIRDVIPSRTAPWLTLVLIAAHAAVFAATALAARDTFAGIAVEYGLTPDHAGLLTATTSMFLHENLVHLAGNLLALWVLGETVEDRLGRGRYLLLYVVAGYAAALAEVWAAPRMATPLLNASGPIAGVIGAHLALFPKARLLVLFPFDLVEAPAAAFIACWFVLQVAGGLGRLASPGSGDVVLWAPLAGCLAGLMLGRVLRRPERMTIDWLDRA